MANLVGPMIKEARTKAGLTQEQLAKKVNNLTAAEISKAERGELELSQVTLKEIAKVTGVTQKSLVEAAKSSTYSGKKSEEKKPAAKKTDSSSTGKKKESQKTDTTEDLVKLTAGEKKLLAAYRKADSSTKKTALYILRGEKVELMELLPYVLEGMEGLGNSGGALGSIGSALGGLSSLLKQ